MIGNATRIITFLSQFHPDTVAAVAELFSRIGKNGEVGGLLLQLIHKTAKAQKPEEYLTKALRRALNDVEVVCEVIDLGSKRLR